MARGPRRWGTCGSRAVPAPGRYQKTTVPLEAVSRASWGVSGAFLREPAKWRHALRVRVPGRTSAATRLPARAIRTGPGGGRRYRPCHPARRGRRAARPRLGHPAGGRVPALTGPDDHPSRVSAAIADHAWTIGSWTRTIGHALYICLSESDSDHKSRGVYLWYTPAS
jgi:hypothetical protein